MFFNTAVLANSVAVLSCLSRGGCNSSNDMQPAGLHPRTNVGNGVQLRIYPLGDSITNGYQSSDDNGYRIGLQRNLAGSNLLFVGSKTGGTMSNGWNEGWNGYKISQIAEKAKQSQSSLDPNLILLHAGTNDLNESPPVDPSHARDRLGALIDQLIADGPDAVILVAQIINAANANTESLIQSFNNAVPRIVSQRANKGHKVMVVDMRGITTADLKDGLHPTDAGYQKMADVWFRGIQAVSDKGWIKPPTTPDPKLGSQSTTATGRYCLQPPFWVEAIKNKAIASGVGITGAMKFQPGWQQTTSGTSGIGKPGASIVFADLNGDGRADYLSINKTSGSVIAYLNTGSGDTMTWNPVNEGKEIASGVAPRSLIRFADIDFDGKDDYVVMGNLTGSVTVYLNRGPKQGVNGGWIWDGPHEVAPGAPGAKGEDVLFADINGDGRPDYLVKNSNGALGAFLNIGKAKSIEGIQWVGAGQIASGLGTNDIAMADINGDKASDLPSYFTSFRPSLDLRDMFKEYMLTRKSMQRADYLIWTKTGSLGGYLNYRTEHEGQPGWASTGNSVSVSDSLGQGKSSAYNRLADFNGDGKVDIAEISDEGAVTLWLNKGSADTSVIGDGVRLASLSGSGLDDYVWLSDHAAVTLYINGGRSEDGQNWIWYPANGGKEIANGAGATRDQIIFADMDGDGKDDFCIVDPKSGAVTLYKNGGAQPNGGWTWIPVNGGQPIASGLAAGRLVRLADLDGDGKADYIFLGEVDGAATVYLNKGENSGAPGGWLWVPYNDGKPIATGIGFPADQVQFKDIDGDGRSEYLGIDKMDGSVIAYANHGPQPNGGWLWIPINNAKPIASGTGAVGRDVRFGRMEKTGRHSYLTLSPNTGALRAWLNGCNELSPATGGSGGSGSSGGTGTGSGQGTGTSNPGGSGSNSGGSGNGSGGSGNNSGGNNSGNSGNSNSGNSGSNGNSGSGSGSNGESLTGQYIGGGKEIPDAGLSGLGLATVGIPAITSLTPYAITAQNALTSASQALKSLTGGNVTPGGVSAAAHAVEIAAKDLEALSQQTKTWDLNSLSSGLKGEAQKEQQTLQDAAKSLSDLVPRLRGCSASRKRDECSDLFNSALTTVGGKPVVTSLTWFPGHGSNTPPGMPSPSDSNNGGSGGSGSGSSLPRLGGGLPFPKGGLGGLGLPRTGAAAVNALKPYAISTQNAVSDALNFFNGLFSGGSPAAADVSAVADSLAAAESDYTGLSSAFGDIELDTLGPSGKTVFNAYPGNLQAATKTLGDRLSQLRGCISQPGACRAIYESTTTVLKGLPVIIPLVTIYNWDGTATATTPASGGTPTGTTSSTTDTPFSWILNTVPGTSLKDYQSFIKTLPDHGAGRQMTLGGHITHRYVGIWTPEDAMIIAKDPIVDTMVQNVRPSGPLNTFITNDTISSNALYARAWTPTIQQDPPSTRNQKILSFPKNEDIRSLSDTDASYEYAYESSGGDGTFVYVFDAGFNFNHFEFLGGETEVHVVDKIRNSNGDLVTTTTDDKIHGTGVASLVSGFRIGIAKSATVIGVKISSDNNPEPENIVDGWTWAINDAKAKNRLGKTVFCWPWIFPWQMWIRNNDHEDKYYQPPYNIPRSQYSDIFVPLLAEAWDVGIVTTISAGNIDMVVDNMGETSPQRFATPNNAIITTVSVDRNGDRSYFNLPIGPPNSGRDHTLVGHETIYVNAEDIRAADAADPARTDGYEDHAVGNSYGVPQVAGLAAYYLGLPNTVIPSLDQLSMKVKKHLLDLARDGSHGGKGVAYNGVWDLPCGAIAKREDLAEQRVEEAAVVLAKLEGLGLGIAKDFSRMDI